MRDFCRARSRFGERPRSRRSSVCQGRQREAPTECDLVVSERPCRTTRAWLKHEINTWIMIHEPKLTRLTEQEPQHRTTKMHRRDARTTNVDRRHRELARDL